MLHDGIDLLIIDRPNKVDSRREGLQGNREKSWRKLTAIVSRVSVVELLKMGCRFMCTSTIAKKIPDKLNVLETCLEGTWSRLAVVAVVAVVVRLGRTLGTSITVAGRGRVAIVVLVVIALVVVVAIVVVTSPSTTETSPSSAKTATARLVSTLKPWRTSIMLTTIVVLVVVVVPRKCVSGEVVIDMVGGMCR
jgi:hypothetical protein